MNSEQIAKLAGVSRSTVSKVLHDYRDVSPKTRQHVLAVMQENGYKPNVMSQALKGISPKVIGLYFYTRLYNNKDPYEFKAHYDTALLASITLEAKKRGYAIMFELLLSSDNEKQIVNNINDAFDGRRICAAILVGLDDNSNFIDKIARYNRHIIVLDKEVDTLNGVRCIFSNDFNSARHATNHLFAQGFKNVMHISGDLKKLSGRERYLGYLDAMSRYNKEHNTDLKPYVHEGIFTHEHGYEAAREYMEKKLYETYDAVVCACDAIAIGFLKYLNEHCAQMINKVGLIGFDDEPMDLYVMPSISTMSVNFNSLARIIFDLEQNYEDHKGGLSIKFDHDLIERDSSRLDEHRSHKINYHMN